MPTVDGLRSGGCGREATRAAAPRRAACQDCRERSRGFAPFSGRPDLRGDAAARSIASDIPDKVSYPRRAHAASSRTCARCGQCRCRASSPRRSHRGGEINDPIFEVGGIDQRSASWSARMPSTRSSTSSLLSMASIARASWSASCQAMLNVS